MGTGRPQIEEDFEIGVGLHEIEVGTLVGMIRSWEE